MANFEVLCGRGRASGKRFRGQSLCEWIPHCRRSCLQKRRCLWGKVILLEAHGGSVNLDANSSNEQGPSRNPESQNVGNRLNPKGKVDNGGGESSVKLALVQRRMEEMKYKIFELKFMVEKGFSDARANKRGSVRRSPVRPTNKRMNRDGDSTTSQLQSSSVRGTERIHPPHMPTGLLIDVNDVREETCKHWSSRNRAEKKGVRLVRRNQVLKLDERLDTNTIHKYMERLWKNLPEAKHKSCTFLDCLWFSMYLEEALSFNVLKWTKAKSIFARQYVFIPIVHWSHWNLLILCHFGEGFGTPTRTPCMLLLDSLKETNPNRLEPLIRKFLIDIHKEEGKQDGDKIIAKIPLLVPDVPQQTNGNDSGVFLLHFIDLFLQSAPENFSISNGCYPYFLTKDWFKSDEIQKRRKHIYNMCLEERHSVS